MTVRNTANDRMRDEMMDDTPAPAPTTPCDTGPAHRNRISLAIAVLTTALGVMLFMSGFAHAEPMISTAGTLSPASALSLESIRHQLGLEGQRLLFGTLTFGFSLLAAGVWHRSFRAVTKPKRPTGH